MLESEAKTKWCPMYRSRDLADNRRRNGKLIDRERNCLGPSCACWVDEGYSAKWEERCGHCGLAR